MDMPVLCKRMKVIIRLLFIDLNSHLKNVHQLSVEELHWELHQLDKEVRDERDIDACGYMQEYLRADKVDSCTAEEEHHLSQEYQPHKAYIFSSNTCIYNRLCKEGKD